MRIEGQENFSSKPGVIWEALHDAETLKACIPGCKEIEQPRKTSVKATVERKIALMPFTVSTQVDFVDRVPFQSFALARKDSKLATVQMEKTAEGGTALKYVLETELGGAAAKLGQSAIEPMARSILTEFFTNLRARLG
ncbi:MAG: hypothetical protein MRY63_07025 [Neomegalonema sp.]|nr:hypothetical protein [Neomegalonema sp.]